ncbi:MAG: hypothetical protein N838_30100 [Thiohalocapsa sp. PB-PSB1]|nr:MAG: hypothetical protein N838_30100 [Thiohalocapsa sp. PB-PSB1]
MRSTPKSQHWRIALRFKRLRARRSDDLHFNLLRIWKDLEIGKGYLGQGIWRVAAKCVFCMEFCVPAFIRMVRVIFVTMIAMTFLGVIAVAAAVMTIIPMVVVPIFAFKFSPCVDDGTACCIRHDKQIEWRTERGNGGINGRKIGIAFGGVFKPDNIGTGGLKRHRDGCPVNCYIQRARAMFMRIKLA